MKSGPRSATVLVEGTSPPNVICGIPVLTTERLLLRGFEPSDFEPYAAMMATPDVTRYFGDGRPVGRADAWRQLATCIGHWKLRGFGLWAVEDRATHQLIGRIGCQQPEGFPAFEIAYTLARTAWGQGFAREGARAALHYARSVLRETVIVSIVRPANIASIRVAESLGATAAETVEFYGAPSTLYRYPTE